MMMERPEGIAGLQTGMMMERPEGIAGLQTG
jgi:hypothetical protein